MCPECSHDNRAGAETCENCLCELNPRAARSPKDQPTHERAPGLAGEPLSALLPKPPVFVARDASVMQAVDTMNRLHIGCVVVGTQDNVAGVFSERDLLFGIGEAYETVKERPVVEFIRPGTEMLETDTPLVDVLRQMASGRFLHVPVAHNGRLVGVVSLRDLLSLVSKWYPDLVG
jgi:CBS domain-containing protein